VYALPVVRRWLATFVERVNAGVRASGTPVAVTSWYRTPSRNAAVGGAPRSQHLLGLAVDLVPLRGSTAQLASALTRAGLVVALERDHVHAQSGRAGVWDRVIDEALRRGVI
jgi:uncharacterized protein YcbK (DUF882 family)